MVDFETEATHQMQQFWNSKEDKKKRRRNRCFIRRIYALDREVMKMLVTRRKVKKKRRLRRKKVKEWMAHLEELTMGPGGAD